MMSRFRFGQKGFTLIEIAVVIVASGLMMAAGVRLYQSYLNDKYANESYDKLRLADSSLALYINSEGKLPCPADPTIPLTDPLAGRSIDDSPPNPPTSPLGGPCYQLRDPATPAGTCLSNVCKADGRDTDADADMPPAADPILIGGLPFRDIRDKGNTQSISQNDVVDPWGYQFTYAVSGYLTDPAKYRATFGAISVQTEGGVSLVDPPGSSQYVIVAHGKNHLGAFTTQGAITFGNPPPAFQHCNPGVTVDSENCDGDNVFISGLRSEGAGATYFDDVLVYNSYSLSMLWDFVGTTNDIYNRNPGFVGIGTSTPQEQLDVAGDISATDHAYMNELCDKATGLNCWSPDLLAAPASTGLSLQCAPSGDPTMDRVMVGIELDGGTPPKPRAKCELKAKVQPLLGSACVPPQFLMGYNSAGQPMCGWP